MKHAKLASLVALSLAIGGGYALAQTAPAAAPAAKAEEKKEEMPSPAVEAYAREFLAKWGNDPQLIAAVKAATTEHRKLSYDDVEVLDNQWRMAKVKDSKEEDDVKATKKSASKLKELAPDLDADAHMKKGEELIKNARGSETSKFLQKQLDAAEPKGAVTEIFVMDGWGWNVGQTGGTSDYYQGDEGKWQMTFASGDPKEVEVLPIVEEDGVRYSQISLPIKDGDKNIGAVTIGVNVDKLK
jgi:hypothetical protein